MINNQADEEIDVHEIADNNQTGWKPTILSDYIDIKLMNAIDIVKIVVLPGSNVKKYKLVYKDINEVEKETQV